MDYLGEPQRKPRRTVVNTSYLSEKILQEEPCLETTDHMARIIPGYENRLSEPVTQ